MGRLRISILYNRLSKLYYNLLEQFFRILNQRDLHHKTCFVHYDNNISININVTCPINNVYWLYFVHTWILEFVSTDVVAQMKLCTYKFQYSYKRKWNYKACKYSCTFDSVPASNKLYRNFAQSFSLSLPKTK